MAIVSFSEDEADLFGVIIESREVSETQKQIFKMAWRYAALGEGARHKGDKKDTEIHTDPKVRKDQLNMF